MPKYVLTQFLVPPGLFVALALLAALRRLRSGAPGAAAFAAFALLIWASACDPVADFLVGRLEAGLAPPVAPRGDVIVVLGGGLSEGVPDLSGTGVPTSEAMARLAAGARLQRRLGLPVLVSGGALLPGRPPEGPVMKRVLVDLGVPADRVAVEPGSRDTFENAALARRAMAERGWRTALLVTSAYHMRRAAFLFSKAGVQAVPVPVQFRTRPGRQYAWADWLPTAGAMRDAAAAGKEFLGLSWYRLALGPVEPAPGRKEAP